LSVGYSQTATNCTQTIRQIRLTYEQGRLHELPDLAKGCLRNGFTKEEKREAYRYLTLAYIYLEEPDSADINMLKLLETDHFYQVNQTIDPAEFIALYKKFRHDPVFRWGIKFGGNATMPTTLEHYNVGSTGSGAGKYGLSGNIQATLAFEKDLPKLHEKLVMAPELGWVNRAFSYNNPGLATLDDDGTTPISSQDFIFKQTWLDLNVIMQWKLENRLERQTYVGLGPGVSYLIGSTNQASTTIGTGANKFTVTGPAVDDHLSFNSLVYSVTAVVGAKLKLGELYGTLDIRYQYGINNVVNESTRTNAEIAFDYQGQYNNYRMSNVMVNLGILIPQFSPKKLIK